MSYGGVSVDEEVLSPAAAFESDFGARGERRGERGRRGHTASALAG